MKKVAIYPLDYNIRELIYNVSMIKNFEINFYIKRDPFSNPGIKNIPSEKVTVDYKHAISNTDILLLNTGNPKIPLQEYLTLIYYAQKLNKKIVITDALLNEFSPEIKNLQSSCDIRFWGNHTVNPYDHAVNKLSLSHITVPTIAVFGVGTYCNKFQCELAIRNYFLQQKYKVLQYGSKEISTLFDFESMPSFIRDTSIPFYNRVIGFNKYIAQKINEENPDLIILGIDDSILPYSNEILNGLGEIPLVVASALNVDIAIINIYNQEHIMNEYISHLLSCGKYRLNSSNTYINISGTLADIQDDHRGLKYYHIDKPLCSLSELNDTFIESKVFTLDEPNSKSNLLDTVFNQLTNNIEIF